MTEARIEALKLTVAGIPNSTETNTPTGSWANTLGTHLEFTDMFENAIANMRMMPGQTANS